jgi:DNA-binding NtrC family response regulator
VHERRRGEGKRMSAETGSRRETKASATSGAFPELGGKRVLVVDDDLFARKLAVNVLRREAAVVDEAGSVREAKQTMAEAAFDAALIDVHLPDGNGMSLASHLRRGRPHIAIVFMTGLPDVEKARTMETIAVDSLLAKPVNASQLLFTLYRELIKRRTVAPPGPEFKDEQVGLIGQSLFIRRMREEVALLARGDIPVLIEGPTGTGKEIIAKAIHNCSRRRDKQLMTVNCAAVAEHLIESELFGHTRGAFTGAIADKTGIVKCADRSTLFLDEVADLSLAMQAKLLRVLDGHGFTRLGDVTPQSVDVRFISATNRDLEEMVEHGTFRRDLFYRLKAGMIRTEPLSTHREDIPLLLEHFLAANRERFQQSVTLDARAVGALVRYEWPGNVRQLKNVVNTLCTVCRGPAATHAELESVLGGKIPARLSPAQTFADAKKSFERSYFGGLLAAHHHNIAAAARAAGIDRGNLSKRLKALGMNSKAQGG